MPSRALRLRVVWRAALLLSAITLSGCSPPVTIISDPVYSALYLEPGSQRDVFSAAVRSEGYRLRVRTVALSRGEDATAADAAAADRELGSTVVEAVTEAASQGPVVVSPLLASFYTDASRATESAPPEVLLLGSANELAAGANLGSTTGDTSGVTVVRFDRREAFRSLGRRLAAMLDRHGPAARAVVLLRTDTGDRMAEARALRDGLGGSAREARFVEFETPPEASAVREELFRVRAPEVVVVGVFLGPRNGIVLDEISGSEAEAPVVATEDLGPAEAYEGFVRFVVERDYAVALERFLGGARGEVTAPALLRDRGPRAEDNRGRNREAEPSEADAERPAEAGD